MKKAFVFTTCSILAVAFVIFAVLYKIGDVFIRNIVQAAVNETASVSSQYDFSGQTWREERTETIITNGKTDEEAVGKTDHEDQETDQEIDEETDEKTEDEKAQHLNEGNETKKEDNSANPGLNDPETSAGKNRGPQSSKNTEESSKPAGRQKGNNGNMTEEPAENAEETKQLVIQEQKVKEIIGSIAPQDKVEAAVLLLKRLTPRDIAELKSFMAGGITAEEKEKAKHIIYLRFSEEEVKRIKEWYSKYYNYLW